MESPKKSPLGKPLILIGQAAEGAGPKRAHGPPRPKGGRELAAVFLERQETAKKAKPRPAEFPSLSMKSPCFQFTLGALVLLMEGRSASSMHHMYYTLTMWVHSGSSVQFAMHTYLDGEAMYYYDNNIREVAARAPWIHKAEEEFPGYWKQNQVGAVHLERALRADVAFLRNNITQTSKILTWQMRFGCVVFPNNTKSTHFKNAYNGRDFLSFDSVSGNWTALDPEAQKSKAYWDARNSSNTAMKDFLETGCIAWLKKYLEYAEGTEIKKSAPKAKISFRVEPDGREVLTCRAYGFSPKEIRLFWLEDGEVTGLHVDYGEITPNYDQTFYTWLRITIAPKQRGRFRCLIDHETLQNPVELFLKKPTNMGSITGGVVGVMLGILLVASLFAYNRNRHRVEQERGKAQKVEEAAEGAQNVEQEAEVTQNIEEEAGEAPSFGTEGKGRGTWISMFTLPWKPIGVFGQVILSQPQKRTSTNLP
ncbi:class I histocompatibility antigen, F10 alpha chain-like [Anolis sagrei]|uniref:class I histocompatibility antigen, F10 alpha chain-like n=1 Tax=Anolis sagrei TaxID=38937 RepID=UPI003521ED17